MASCTRPLLTAVISSVNSGGEVPIAKSFAPPRIAGTPKTIASLKQNILLVKQTKQLTQSLLEVFQLL